MACITYANLLISSPLLRTAAIFIYMHVYHSACSFQVFKLRKNGQEVTTEIWKVMQNHAFTNYQMVFRNEKHESQRGRYGALSSNV